MQLRWLLSLLGTLGTAVATPALPLDDYQLAMKQLLQKLLWSAHLKTCFAIITDDLHADIYDGKFFDAISRQPLPGYMLRVRDSADLLQPGNRTQRLLQAIKASDCDLHVISMLNALQVGQLLRFAYDSRSLNLQRKFVLLHDARLFEQDMLQLWSVMTRSVFLQRQANNSFRLSTIAYPGVLSGFLVVQQLGHWQRGRPIDGQLWSMDKTRNLKGVTLPVALLEHVPMVQQVMGSNRYQGVEIEIVNALAKTLNFLPLYQRANDSDAATEPPSDPPPMAPLSPQQGGVIGELTSHSARLAIGNLHLFQVYLDHIELSQPHSFQCLTFLTPESSADSSWQTFILPFSAGMWAGVLLSLFAVGTIFYVFSYFHALLGLAGKGKRGAARGFFGFLRRRSRPQLDEATLRSVQFRIALSRQRPTRAQLQHGDLFDSYANCILLTYSMLLYVSLPRMPHNWPLRVLTGWYWVYCLLLVATYRASFTAILANPAARITIDTLQDLLHSQIPPIVGDGENQKLFSDAVDETAQKLANNMQILQNSDDDLTSRIARGQCAYYDNEFYLRYLRVANEHRGVGSAALHIMRECVIHMPVGLALEKNSPLKSVVDSSIMHLNEGGLITKWLQDAIMRLPAEEDAPQEALMNLQKFWSSFVALAIGYTIAVCCMCLERWHFKHVIMKHPLYDVYNPSLYYKFKRRYPEM